jgi:hypothetical protein
MTQEAETELTNDELTKHFKNQRHLLKMSFEEVCKELLNSAERSAVVRVVNNSSHQLDVKACNIWQGRWHIEPESVPPHSEKVFAAKSQGRIL